MNRNVAVFDFDGTLTTRDTLFEFIRFVKGLPAFLVGLLVCSPFIVAYLVRLYPNYKAKQKLFSYFFKGMPYDEFCRYGQDFISVVETIKNQPVVNEFEQCCREGSAVYIVSASITEWVKPWGMQAGATDVLGTQVEVDESGFLTGRFLSKNCYGQEKVNRLQAVEPERGAYRLTAYGDSGGDKQMLAYADEAHFVGKTMREKLCDLWHQERFQEVVRFGIVGSVAALIQFLVYFFTVAMWNHNLSIVVSYLVSMCFNFLMTVYFTFRVSPSMKKVLGFVMSHAFNLFLQVVTLNFFVWIGVDKQLAIIPVFLICVPVNFVLVRLSVRDKQK